MARSFTSANNITTTANIVTTSGVGYSASGWSMVTGGAGTTRCIFRSVGGGGNLGLYVSSGNVLAFLHTGLSGTSFTPTIGVWFSWLINWTANTSLGAFIYANNSQVGNFDAPAGETGTWTIGNDSFGQVLNGAVADLAFWPASGAGATPPLSTLDIKAQSQGARPYTIQDKLLKIWFPLDGLASPEPDLSGSANTGTVTGSPLAFGPPFAAFTPRWPQPPIIPPVFTLMPQIVT